MILRWLKAIRRWLGGDKPCGCYDDEICWTCAEATNENAAALLIREDFERDPRRHGWRALLGSLLILASPALLGYSCGGVPLANLGAAWNPGAHGFSVTTQGAPGAQYVGGNATGTPLIYIGGFRGRVGAGGRSMGGAR